MKLFCVLKLSSMNRKNVRLYFDISEPPNDLTISYTPSRLFQRKQLIDANAIISYGCIPDFSPCVVIYASPATGKSTFINQYVDSGFIDTDYNFPFNDCFMITNIYEYTHRCIQSYAILPSREVHDARLAYRCFDEPLLCYWDYDRVLSGLSPNTTLIYTDKYLHEVTRVSFPEFA